MILPFEPTQENINLLMSNHVYDESSFNKYIDSPIKLIAHYGISERDMIVYGYGEHYFIWDFAHCFKVGCICFSFVSCHEVVDYVKSLLPL